MSQKWGFTTTGARDTFFDKKDVFILGTTKIIHFNNKLFY